MGCAATCCSVPYFKVRYGTVGGYYSGTGFRRAMVAIRPYQTQGKNNPFDLDDDDHEINEYESSPY